MNLSVFVFSFFGDRIKGYFINKFYSQNRRIFTPSNRRIVTIWQKYGLIGVALLTPPLLTPPVGALVATGFGEEKKKIFLYMFVSSILWGWLLCYASYSLKEEIEVIKEFLSVVISSTANSSQRIFIL
jgi:membrane protein DedA with SNARE-associated domain